MIKFSTFDRKNLYTAENSYRVCFNFLNLQKHRKLLFSYQTQEKKNYIHLQTKYKTDKTHRTMFDIEKKWFMLFLRISQQRVDVFCFQNAAWSLSTGFDI